MKRTAIAVALLSFAASSQAGERTATFSVPAMTCALCPVTIKTAMSGVAGVKSVSTAFATKTAIAVFEDTQTTVAAIAAASANAGYPATLVSLQ
jgi:periplasmic mercuric ion binding protein